MEKIGLLIDSTSHTSDALKSYDFIKTVNLKVIIEDEEYLEKDLSSEDMLKHIEAGKKMKTSQPAPTDFLDQYEAFAKEDYTHVLVIVLSDQISGTFQSAMLSKNLNETDLDISIHSPQAASFGLANGLRLLAKDIQSGMSFENVMKRYYEIFEHPHISFTLDNLKHLFRGGRLNRIQAFIGSVLRIKPIVQMVDGKLKLVHKERTYAKCLDFFMEQVHEYMEKFENVYIDIIHLNMEKWANKLKDAIEEKYDKTNIFMTETVSPVFYVHLGDQGFGISIIGY